VTKPLTPTHIIFIGLGILLGSVLPAAAGVFTPRAEHAIQVLETWSAGDRAESPALPAYARHALSWPGVAGLAVSTGTEPRLRLLAVTDDVDALRDAGADVGTVAGRAVVFEIPLAAVRGLEHVPGLRSVNLPMPLQPALDVSVPEIGAAQVHGSTLPPYSGMTGKGVVVGIVDTGLDLAHEDFRNADGTTRVSLLWDQTDKGGPHPGFPNFYSYGTEWTAADINSGAAREKDTDGHGTHVSGIAVGNGRATGNGLAAYTYVGVAPEAEILFCKTTLTSDAVLDAVSWIQGSAGSRPCVVNLSLGSQAGPHDGTGELDIALAGLAGPGRILVAAAGSYNLSRIHAQALIPGLSTVTFNMYVPFYSYTSNEEMVLIDGWYAGSGLVNVYLTTPSGHVVAGGSAINTSDGFVFLDQGIYAGNGDRNVVVDISDRDGESPPPATGYWAFHCQNMQATPTEIDFWIFYANLGVDVFWTNNVDNSELVLTPASSDSVLGVGAYVTKTTWNSIDGLSHGYGEEVTLGARAPFSNPGPNRDGGLKPDISAPGMGIASSKSADATDPLLVAPGRVLPDGQHVISQGSSQASPHVAGVVALMLQANPGLSVGDVRKILVSTARHDAFTGTGWSNYYGAGKIDALAAVNQFVPIRLLALGAKWVEGRVVVSWTLREAESEARFQVERGSVASGPFHDVSGPVTEDRDSWTDYAPDPAEPWYGLRALLRDGSVERYGPVHLDAGAIGVRLRQNAPNPFASETAIAFELDRARPVRLDVVDVSGRLVATLLEGERPAGRNEVRWDGTDRSGRPAAAGLYFARLTTSASIQVCRMMRIQ